MTVPLVVILGPTGSGKTKLSLELAKKFNTEIIGADSMQIYKGLDIISAKATKEEQSIAPHHLLDILNPTEIFTIHDYRNKAIEIINKLLADNKVPIIVGGTNYYIESILWKILVDDPGITRVEKPGILPNDEHELSSEELHKKLQNLDPAMAVRLHPNDKRKVIRSLEILYRNGRKHSDILNEQQSSEGGSCLGGGLRYPNAVIFWLQCEQETLNERLDLRVDSMVQEGLLNELEHFHKHYNEERVKNEIEPDYTKGVFQAIGLKEFHKYLVLSADERNTENGRAIFAEGLKNLKIVTKRYSRNQNRWIINRLLANTERQVPPLYGLNTDDLSKFDEDVTNMAIEIVDSYLRNIPCKYEPLPKREKRVFPSSKNHHHRCEACKRIFLGEDQWEVHKKSRKHRKMLAKHLKQTTECK